MSVLAVAGVLLVGSQAIRSQRPTNADAISSPSPSASCPQYQSCPDPSPTLGPGVGPQCSYSPDVVCSSPEPLPVTSQPPAISSPNSVAPVGTIQVSSTVFAIPGSAGGTGGKLGIMVAVLFGGAYVSGASVTMTCSGPGVSVPLSGSTAARTAWPPSVDPSIPNGPSDFFWSVQHVTVQEGGQYICHGSASYNGVSASF